MYASICAVCHFVHFVCARVNEKGREMEGQACRALVKTCQLTLRGPPQSLNAGNDLDYIKAA